MRSARSSTTLSPQIVRRPPITYRARTPTQPEGRREGRTTIRRCPSNTGAKVRSSNTLKPCLLQPLARRPRSSGGIVRHAARKLAQGCCLEAHRATRRADSGTAEPRGTCHASGYGADVVFRTRPTAAPIAAPNTAPAPAPTAMLPRATPAPAPTATPMPTHTPIIRPRLVACGA
jgi:hypothetical protein